jgi:hypothetical protein
VKHDRALHATLWCAPLAQTTPTPSLHSPEKSSVRLVYHQNLIVHQHLPGSAHIHVYPCDVRHQLRILMNTAASTVDLTPPCHPSAPTISKLGVLHHKRLGHGRQLTLNVESQLPPTPLTTAEAECLFFFVQFSLSGLVSGEISCCRLHAGGSARASQCDPTDDIVRVWSRFASWYMAIKTCRLSDHEVICRG